eukprot:IDg2657t1
MASCYSAGEIVNGRPTGSRGSMGGVAALKWCCTIRCTVNRGRPKNLFGATERHVVQRSKHSRLEAQNTAPNKRIRSRNCYSQQAKRKTEFRGSLGAERERRAGTQIRAADSNRPAVQAGE